MWSSRFDNQNCIKLGIILHTSNPKWKQEDQKFSIILPYIVSSSPVWAIHDHLSRTQQRLMMVGLDAKAEAHTWQCRLSLLSLLEAVSTVLSFHHSHTLYRTLRSQWPELWSYSLGHCDADHQKCDVRLDQTIVLSRQRMLFAGLGGPLGVSAVLSLENRIFISQFTGQM